MIATKIIEKYYPEKSDAHRILVDHSTAVARKAVKIAEGVKHLHPDIRFIEEAAMLHDIGVFLTNAPEIGCFGESPYLAHGVSGRNVLEKEGFPRHALVCERHIGVGIIAEEIKRNKLPLPERDMVPLSVEEEIICLADKFFGKSDKNLFQERSVKEIKENLGKHGEEKIKKLELLIDKYQIKDLKNN